MRDDLSASGDMVGGQVGDWLVTGWFTPDYPAVGRGIRGQPDRARRRISLVGEAIARRLEHSRKPSVVLETMDAYPGKTIILADVDCVMRGDVAPAAQIDGDVGITVIARNVHNGRKWRHWISTECSSRVVVFRPTGGARTF